MYTVYWIMEIESRVQSYTMSGTRFPNDQTTTEIIKLNKFTEIAKIKILNLYMHAYSCIKMHSYGGTHTKNER